MDWRWYLVLNHKYSQRPKVLLQPAEYLCNVEDHVLALSHYAVNMINHTIDPSTVRESRSVTLDQIRISGEVDQDHLDLIAIIVSGFPNKKSSLSSNLREFWEVRDRLSHSDGIVLMNHCIVIPKASRKQILQNLHDAHQGTTGMSAHANKTVYWPGMNACILNHRV